MLHVVNTYYHKDPKERARLDRAASTWPSNTLKIPTEELDRNSKSELGDVRELPFIRDIINKAFLYTDVVVLTNADSCLVVDWQDCIRVANNRQPNTCFWSNRRNFSRFPKRRLTSGEIVHRGDPFEGIDLVVIPRVWWDKADYPDLVLGCEGWDFVFKFSRETAKLRDLVYHEYHYPPFWMANRECPGELHNKQLCHDWAKRQPDSAVIFRDWTSLETYDQGRS